MALMLAKLGIALDVGKRLVRGAHATADSRILFYCSAWGRLIVMGAGNPGNVAGARGGK